MKVLCILTDGFEDIEAIGTIALLRRSGIGVDVATLYNKQATGKYQNTIVNLEDIHSINTQDYDGLFLPGGPHYEELENDSTTQSIIHHFFTENKYVAAICAAPTILGRMGYLKDKKYTCFTSMNEDFGGTYIDDYAVIDNKLITGKSAAAVIDFAFAIIKTLQSEAQEKLIKKQIYYEKD